MIGTLGSGAVYVFRRSGTTWRQEAYLKASNTSSGEVYFFGWSAAVDGNTLAVGAPPENGSATGVDGNPWRSGAVYVFRRSGTTWRQEAYLKASNAGADDVFGWSVALQGDTLAVGAYNEDSEATGIDGDQSNNGAEGSGAVYVRRIRP